MSRIQDLSREIVKRLKEYTDEVTEGLEESKKTIAQNTAKRLRETSPKGKTGNYAKGWRVTNINGKQVVHNKTDYQKTHLLEKGHAKVNGGRVPGKPHIRQAEEKAIEEFEEAVERLIRR